MTARDADQVRGHQAARSRPSGAPSRPSRSAARWRRSSRPRPGPASTGSRSSRTTSSPARSSPPSIRPLAADLGLEILLYQPFRDFEAVPDDQLAANLRRAERKFAVMAALGADTLLVCSSVSRRRHRRRRPRRRPAAPAGRAGRPARPAHRLRGAGLGPARQHATPHAWRIVSRAPIIRALGLCLDSFHILSLRHDPRRIRDLPGEKIFFLQLADAPGAAHGRAAVEPALPLLPRSGRLRPDRLHGRRARRRGYPGPLSLEVFNDVFRQADAERTARDGMRSLLTLEDRSLAHRDPTGAGRGPARPPAAAGPPARGRQPAPGYAFVELAVDGLLGAGGRARAAEPGLRPARPAPHQAGGAVAAGPPRGSWSTGAGRGPAGPAGPGSAAVAAPGHGERRPGPVGPPGPGAAGPGHPPPLRARRGRPHRGGRAGRDRGLLLPGRRRRPGRTGSATSPLTAGQPAGRADADHRRRPRRAGAARRLLRRGRRCSTSRCWACSRRAARRWPRPTAWSAAARCARRAATSGWC